MDKLDGALKMLDKRLVLKQLLRQVKASMEHPNTDLATLHREFELHFGPSHLFKQIFVKALIYQATPEIALQKQAPVKDNQPAASQSPFGWADEPAGLQPAH